MKTRLFALLSAIALFASCNTHTSTCRETVNPEVQVAFYRVVYNSTTEKVQAQTYSFQAYIQGIGSDSLLYDGTTQSSVSLPLKRTDSCTQFSLQFFAAQDPDLLLCDTLTFLHTNSEQFISLECGCGAEYTIDKASATINGIDSIVLIESEVLRAQTKTTHLKVYIK